MIHGSSLGLGLDHGCAIISTHATRRHPSLRVGVVGLEENFKALPICLENSSFIVQEGNGAVIGGVKNVKQSLPLCAKLAMAKQADTRIIK